MKYKEPSQLPKTIQEVHRVFRKTELIDIADELDADYSLTYLDRINTRDIVLLIINHIEEHDFPNPDKCSDNLYEFLLNIDYINEDGERIDPSDRLTYEEVPIIAPGAKNGPLANDPECFSFAEIRDPSCKACAIFDRCSIERTSRQPDCFGLLFSVESEECRGCIEAFKCREKVGV